MSTPARAAALILILVLAAFGFAACGGGDDESTATATEATSTAADDEAGGSEETGADTAATGGDAAAGETVWNDNGCGTCHTMAAADATGTTGPDLDELQPDFEAVVAQVTNGGGVMPAFGEELSQQQIDDVAAYVVESTSD